MSADKSSSPSVSIPRAAHTPAPWHVEPTVGEDDQQFWSDDFNGTVWCVCHPQTVCDATTVANWLPEADARLIAAAPELLSALTPFARFLDALEAMGGTSPKTGDFYTIVSSASGERTITVEDFKAARAAINKALGR